MALAILLTGMEAGLPYLKEFGLLDFLPGGLFAILTVLVIMAALTARLTAQINLEPDRDYNGRRKNKTDYRKQNGGDHHRPRPHGGGGGW